VFVGWEDEKRPGKTRGYNCLGTWRLACGESGGFEELNQCGFHRCGTMCCWYKSNLGNKQKCRLAKCEVPSLSAVQFGMLPMQS
jgi:hypothetical protein